MNIPDRRAAAQVILHVLGMYAAALMFNLLFGSYYWLPDHRWGRLAVPVPEASAAVLILFLFSRSGSKRFRRSGIILVSVLFASVFLFNLGETLFLYVYRRDFAPLTHLFLIPEFFSMVFRSDVFRNSVFLVPAALGTGLILSGFFYLVSAGITKGFSRIHWKAGGLFVPAAALFFLLFLPARVLPAVLVQGLRQDRTAAETAGGADSAPLEAGAVSKEGFPGIQDADIYLFIIESYGNTVFSNPHHFDRLKSFFSSQQKKLSSAGFRIFSTVYESTTFGGTSWLADASLLTGLDIDTQAKFNAVINGGTKNLLHLFEEKGYYTVLSAPGTTVMTGKHKEFYKFSRYILHDDFGYEGPYFTFGDMPDQYQIHHVEESVIVPFKRNRTRPFFAEFILVSSHVPWNYIPPVLKDWDLLGDGSIYNDRRKNTYYDNSWAVGSEFFEGYAHSLRYVLEVLTDYIADKVDHDSLVILVGDHQPKFPVSEKGAGFGVPLHIISRRLDSVFPFTRYGYVPGFVPSRESRYYGLEDFLSHFIRVAEGHVEGRPRGTPVRVPEGTF